jgi:hypothetical protein
MAAPASGPLATGLLTAAEAIELMRRTAMGSRRWSTDVYDAPARYRAGAGKSAFAHSDSAATSVHPSLDLGEDAISLNDGLCDLDDVGSDAAPAVAKPLAAIGSCRSALISVALDDLDGPDGNFLL